MVDNVLVWKRIERDLEQRIENLWIDRYFSRPDCCKGISSTAADRSESEVRSSSVGSGSEKAAQRRIH